MYSPDPSAHQHIGRGVRNFNNAVCSRVREDAVLAGNFVKVSQNPTMKDRLLSTGTQKMAEASPFNPVWGIGLRADDSEARDPRRWRGKICSEKLFLRFATPFAPVRPGWQREPPLSNSVPRPPPAEFIRFPQRRLTPGLWCVLAQVLLRIFPPVFLTRRRTATPTSWLSRLGSTPPSRYQNMVPASSAVSLLSTTPLLPRRLQFTVEPTSSRPTVTWRSLTLVPHRLSSNAFEAASRARSFASSRITRRSKAWAKWEITLLESSGCSSFSPRSITPSSTARAAPTEMPISCPVCQSLPRNTTALNLAASPPVLV